MRKQRSNFYREPQREINYQRMKNKEYDKATLDDLTIPILQAACSSPANCSDREKFKPRNIRNTTGKKENEEFNKLLPEEFNEFDPHGLYECTTKTTEYQTYAKLIDSMMISTVLQFVNADQGMAQAMRPDDANFYRDIGFLTPLVAAFYSAVGRISYHHNEINQVGNIHTLPQIRAQTVTAAQNYRLGHYLSIVPDVRLWIYIILNVNELNLPAVQSEIMRRIRITIESPQHAEDALDYQSIQLVLGVTEHSTKEHTLLKALAIKLNLHMQKNNPGLSANELSVPRNIVMAEYAANKHLLRGRGLNVYDFIRRKKQFSGIHVPRVVNTLAQFCNSSPLVNYPQWSAHNHQGMIIGSYDNIDGIGALYSNLLGIHSTV
ncbi:hypothetical protein GJ496_006889 [Pomphorhynchus laevis]|nr:hypothetical protein GJ496_006889 [Pomphorhynchus laevis]